MELAATLLPVPAYLLQRGTRTWVLKLLPARMDSSRRGAPLHLSLAQLRGEHSLWLRQFYTERLYRQLRELPHKVLPSLGASPSTFVSDVRFDAVGELLATCSSNGEICVHQHEQLLCGAMGNDASRARVHCEPLCTLRTQKVARTVRWNPSNQNEIMAAYADSSDLHAFDLAAACPERPKYLLRSKVEGGVNDALFMSDGSTVVAGGRDGLLRLWDVRMAGTCGIVRQSQATHRWTLGLKTEVCVLHLIAIFASNDCCMRLIDDREM